MLLFVEVKHTAESKPPTILSVSTARCWDDSDRRELITGGGVGGVEGLLGRVKDTIPPSTCSTRQPNARPCKSVLRPRFIPTARLSKPSAYF